MPDVGFGTFYNPTKARKDQIPKVEHFEAGGMNIRKPALAQTHDGLEAARQPRETGQLAPDGTGLVGGRHRSTTKHRAGRRSRTFLA